MKKTTILGSIVLSLFIMMSSCSSNTESINLFNGQDLEGWVGYLDDSTANTDAEFIVKDGVIHLGGKLGYLHTEDVYSNYKLTAEWRWVDSATNSGIFLYLQPEYQGLPENFEFQLKAGHAGDIYNSSGAYCAESDNETNFVVEKQKPSNEKPVGEWNYAEIICDGNTITAYVNGELQNKVTGTSLDEGYIGLQSEGGPVEFRNIVLTPLDK